MTTLTTTTITMEDQGENSQKESDHTVTTTANTVEEESVMAEGSHHRHHPATEVTTTDGAAEKKQLDLTRLGLYGREREIKALKSSFKAMLKAHAKHEKNYIKGNATNIPTQVVWIEGVSGSGKTALVNQLQLPAKDNGCFFVSGKFDLPHGHADMEKQAATAAPKKGYIKSKSSKGNSKGSQKSPGKASIHMEPTRLQQTLLYQGIRLALDKLCEQILELPCKQILDLSQKEGPVSIMEGDHSIHGSNTGGSGVLNNKEMPSGISTPNKTKTTTTPTIYFEDAREVLIEGLQGSFDVLDLLVPKLALIRNYGNQNHDNQSQDSGSGSGGMSSFDTGSAGSATGTIATSKTKERQTALVQQNFRELADRMKYACRRLIQIVSTRIAPIVLVLDDLQWADQSSLDLLLHWLTDSATGALMLLGCYRSDQVNSQQQQQHPLLKLMARVESLQQKGHCNATSRKIILQNLGISEIEDLLETLFDSNAAVGATLGLADIIMRKTGGNSFWVIEFIQYLSRSQNNLLEYNSVSKLWEWDEEEIMVQTQATNNIASLMKELLHQSAVAQYLLPMAACLGSTISAATLFRVHSSLEVTHPGLLRENLQRQASGVVDSTQDLFAPAQTVQEMEMQLDQCTADGFLERICTGMYRFIHDQVQEASLNLIDPSNLMELEFHIGQAVLEVCDSEDELADLIFSILEMLNPKVVKLQQDDPKRMQIAVLNQKAAVQAMTTSSFETASWYYRRAISLLPLDRWTRWNMDSNDNEANKLYELTLSLYTNAAFAEAGNKDEDAMLAYATGVQEHARDIYDKLPVYHMMMDWFLSREAPRKSVEIGLTILRHLGVRFPKNEILLTGSVVAGLIKSKGLVQKSIDMDVADMPVAEDKTTKAIVRTMDKMCTSAYLVNEKLMALSIFTAARTVFTAGLTDDGCVILAGFGLAMSNKLHDYKLGKKCAERALEMVGHQSNKRMSTSQFSARVSVLAYGFTLHFMRPLQSVAPLLLDGAHAGIRSGDFESTALCAYFYVQALFDCGKSLALIESTCALFTRLGEDFGQDKVALCLRGFWQAMLNLIGDDENKDPTRLSGSQMQYDVVEAMFRGLPHCEGIAPYRKMQMINAIFLGEHEFGANMAIDIGEDVFEKCLGMVSQTTLRFANALSCYHMVQQQNRKRSGKYLSYAKKSHKQLKDWIEKANNPNLRHLDALLEAEAAIVKGDKPMKIVRYFDEALAFAHRGTFLRDEALISQHYAIFWKREGSTSEFEHHAMAALTLYQELGAQAVVRKLSDEWRLDLGELLDELPARNATNNRGDEDTSISSVTSVSLL